MWIPGPLEMGRARCCLHPGLQLDSKHGGAALQKIPGQRNSFLIQK